MSDNKGTSNVITLRPSTLQKAYEEAASLKLKTWVMVALTTDDNLKVWGPERCNFIEMLGMIEYSKTQLEQEVK